MEDFMLDNKSNESEIQINAQVQVTPKQLYKFNLYHCYFNSSNGMFGIVLGIICIFYALSANKVLGTVNTIIVVLLGIMFFVYNPISLYIRSKSRYLRNDALKKPLNYCFDDKGFVLSQEGQSEDMEWADLYKVKESKECIYFFFTRIHANIVPKKCLGDDLDTVLKLIDSNVEGKKNKLKKEHKA